jgi:hypothetical protein
VRPLASVGRQVFERVFAERSAARAWTTAEADLAGVRVEIDAESVRCAGCAVEAAA